MTLLPPSTSGNIVQSDGSTFISSPLDLDSAQLAGTLDLNRGGSSADLSGLATGALIAKGSSALEAANLTANNVVLGNGTGAPSLVAPGTSGNVLTSNGSTWQSQALPNGASLWDITNNIVHLNAGTNNVTIGNSSNLGKFGVVGDSDEIQTIIKGHTTQNENLMELRNSSDTVLSVFDPNGQLGIGTDNPAAPLDVHGRVQITGDLEITKAAGNARHVRFLTGGSQRWAVGADAIGEAGANVGSHFEIKRYSDAGSLIDIPLFISRNTAHVVAETAISSPLHIVNGTSEDTNAGSLVWRLGGHNGLTFFLPSTYAQRPIVNVWTPTAANIQITGTSGVSLSGGSGALSIPANFWTVGKILEIIVYGDMTIAGAGSNRSNLDILIGGSVELSADTTILTNSGRRPFEWKARFRCTAIGTSGNFEMWAIFNSPELGVCRTDLTGAASFSTTVNQSLGIQLYWNAANNTANIQGVEVNWIN